MMKLPNRIPLVRTLVLAVLVFVFGVGGVLAGHFLRRSLARPHQVMVLAPQSLLEKGMEFPEVPLTRDDGGTAGTRELRGDNGCVILFLDLDCPPCGDMAQKWHDVLSSGRSHDLRVFGVTYHPPDAIEGFKLDYGISFPIFQDAGKVFLSSYKVDRFPLEVVVGASGKIRGTSYDPASLVDPAVLSRLLADAPR